MSSRRRVRIVAPSSPFDPEKLAAGVERLEGAGFTVDQDDVNRAGHAFLNGTDDERRRELVSALEDPSVDIVWLARGGYGLTRFVHRVRFPTQCPIVVGFSDATALLGPAFNSGCTAVHGPLATTLADEPEDSFEHLMAILERRARGRTLDGLSPVAGPRVEVEGPLFAANLCVLTHLVGTRAVPSLHDSIVVLEEIGERPYRIDRMLTQLLESGVLDGVAAIVVGRLTDCEEPGIRRPRNKTPLSIETIQERLEPLGIPVLTDAPVGHGGPNFAIPVGARGKIAFRGARALLELTEEIA
jgi:muramoyltetrapeptide carboxypeptidase